MEKKSCKSQDKINEPSKQQRNRGRLRTKENSSIYSSVLNIDISFLLTKAKPEPIPTKEFFNWLIDINEDKIMDLERYLENMLWFSAVRGGELVNLEDSALIGNKLTIKTSKKHNDKESFRSVYLPKGLLTLKEELTHKGLL